MLSEKELDKITGGTGEDRHISDLQDYHCVWEESKILSSSGMPDSGTASGLKIISGRRSFC